MAQGCENRIKVIYFIPQLMVGGTERHLCDLVTNLDGNLYEPVVWCPGPWGAIGDELLAAGIEVVRFKLPRVLLLHRFFKVLRYLKGRGFTIFHSYGYWPIWVDAVVAKLAGIGVYISSRRNTRYWKGGERLHFGERVRNYFSDVVVANCEAVKKKSIEVEKLPPEKIKVIYNGVNFSNINPDFDTSGLKSRLGISDGDIVIGTVGNLKPVKRQEFLIRAVAEVLQKTDKVKLAIAGQGPEKENLLMLADALKIKEHVVITSSGSDRFRLFGLFDIFVLSSSAEGFPNAVIEAMAMGKPVVASNVGGVAEAVRDGENGFLFETQDQLNEKLGYLVEDENLRDKMGMKNSQMAREFFGLDDKINQYGRLYENLLHHKRD